MKHYLHYIKKCKYDKISFISTIANTFPIQAILLCKKGVKRHDLGVTKTFFLIDFNLFFVKLCELSY